MYTYSFEEDPGLQKVMPLVMLVSLSPFVTCCA